MVKKKHPKKYQYIVKAGKSLKNAIFTLYSLVWKKEVMPEKWMDSTFVQLSKDSGRVSDLNSVCHIHVKDSIPWSQVLGRTPN